MGVLPRSIGTLSGSLWLRDVKTLCRCVSPTRTLLAEENTIRISFNTPPNELGVFLHNFLNVRALSPKWIPTLPWVFPLAIFPVGWSFNKELKRDRATPGLLVPRRHFLIFCIHCVQDRLGFLPIFFRTGPPAEVIPAVSRNTGLYVQKRKSPSQNS